MPTCPRRGDPPVFHLVLIKPTHYDDDGYPIRWVKAAIPSNTLASLNSLAEDAARRQVLGSDVAIRLHTFDETNQRVRPARIIRAIRSAGGRALIGLVGVQSNQFPRAVDLARPFRAAGLPVCIGGFHVSGTIAMLPQMTPKMVKAQALGISFFAGEAEGGRLDRVLRDIDIMKRELPLDVLELFYLTPLPGSEDHKMLWQDGVWMDDDLNKYDLYHRVMQHPHISDDDWKEAYRAAWESFYSFDHIYTILRRAAANPNGRPRTILSTLLWFKLATMFEGVHSLEAGAFRRKTRREWRYGLPRENPLFFYPRYMHEIAVKARGYWSVYRRSKMALKAVLAAPDRTTYTDVSIAPPEADEFDNLDLYHATSGGEAALARKRRDDALREKAH